MGMHVTVLVLCADAVLPARRALLGSENTQPAEGT